MLKFFLFLIIFFTKFTYVNAEIIKSILVNGNERVSDETVIIFSNVNVGDDLIINDLNNIINNLYTTDFFYNVSVSLNNNILKINVIENKFVKSLVINGVKNKKLNQSLLDLLEIKENKAFIKEKTSRDTIKLSNFLKNTGYYFI
ncbi:hypothetical protein N9K63_00410 [Candidatus Pelagibacter bacterium]|nr:hypothetical protein [Candidatus Pelagibacter bacterium]